MRRITLWVECPDNEADLLAKRLEAYLSSIGGMNVQVVKIEELRQPFSNK